LLRSIENPFEYIAFFGLRTHGLRGSAPHTEEVYVHSKVMIVDDVHTIIGSANINDRSMNGDRDSEIAVVVEDKQMVPHVRLGRII
jgi:phospholipase D1/2